MNRTSTNIFPPNFSITVLVCIVVLAIQSVLTPRMIVHDTQYAAWDSQRYLAAAEGSRPDLAGQAPFCWRLLVPKLAGFMPFGVENGFYVLTIVSLLLSAILLVLFSHCLGFGASEVYCVMFLFLFSRWTTGYLLFDFALVDAPAFVFILLILWLTERSANRWLIIVLIVFGTLIKEQVILAALYSSIVFYQQRAQVKGRFLMSLLPIAACILVLLATRLLIHPTNNYTILHEISGRFSSLHPVGYGRYSTALAAGFAYDIIVGTWGAILPLFTFGIWKMVRTSNIQWQQIVFLLFVYGQLLLAWNTERLLIYAFPVVFVIAVGSLGFLPEHVSKFKGLLLWSTVALQVTVYTRSLLTMNGFHFVGLRDLLTSIIVR